MILIGAIPLKRGALYNYKNEHFINPERIKVALYNDAMYSGGARKVNVILDDNSEWIIAREVFDSMRMFYEVERDLKCLGKAAMMTIRQCMRRPFVLAPHWHSRLTIGTNSQKNGPKTPTNSRRELRR